MDTLFSRHRALALLAAAILLQVLLLAFQIKRDHDVRLIRYWAAAAVMPFERGGTWSLSKIGGVWGGYFGLRGTRAENARLRADVDALRLRNQELEGQAAEAQRLALLLNFHNTHTDTPMIAALVIGASADPSSHTLSLNRGDRDHIRRNMAVITPDGIVGKIVEVFPTTSEVLVINDKDSGAGALLADTRTHGVAKGSDTDTRLDYVVNDEHVHAGELVLTSGEDRIFPKDLLIGTVTSASPATPFQAIHIRPAAHLDRLEEVLILLTQQELKETAGSSGSADATGAPSNSHGIVQAPLPQQSNPAPVSNKATPSNLANTPPPQSAPLAAKH